ncbi:MAG: tRNA preQ1(34) S-adenosylmethionine ribosyltransferase-isomerase QueA [Deltaproteobacteria bacterium]|nr:tRNA preQ1(34) S-adenosylmethionine ribosyltransferase-isomerase QueA [Deltaproteobacteria bacterium]
MALEDFDYHLPPELIAQHPSARRGDSRLMVVGRADGAVQTAHFSKITDKFRPGDLLVVNDTRVIPARLLGTKEGTGGRVEVFLVTRKNSEAEEWSCLTRASKRLKPGQRIFLGEKIRATVVGEGEHPFQEILFECDGEFLDVVEKVGHIPLPPYIRREDLGLDRERYQTIFAASRGAVAAPTAGLHFSPEVLQELTARGVEVCSLTLHVGLGTFLPVRVDNLAEHQMHEEFFAVSTATAAAVNQAKAEGRRVFAVGTTVTRTLESALDDQGRLRAMEGSTRLFIRPGFRFRMVDALITNFHLPQSTLLMLVSAFAGRELVLEAYRQAVAEKFRFFSYGDCMLII